MQSETQNYFESFRYILSRIYFEKESLDLKAVILITGEADLFQFVDFEFLNGIFLINQTKDNKQFSPLSVLFRRHSMLFKDVTMIVFFHSILIFYLFQ